MRIYITEIYHGIDFGSDIKISRISYKYDKKKMFAETGLEYVGDCIIGRSLHSQEDADNMAIGHLREIRDRINLFLETL